MALQLSTEPDGFGFHYGQIWRAGEMIRIDVLPPARLWRGEMMLEGAKPDEEAWVIFLDGEEVARVFKREDIEQAAIALPINFMR